MISFENNHPLNPEHYDKLLDVLDQISSDHSYSIKNLLCIVLSDNELLEINKAHLDHDYYTDVITFDMSEESSQIDGEIYVSIDRIEENAKSFNVSVAHEFSRVVIHGLLHLLGFNDQSLEEKKTIRQKEDEYLNLLPQ